MTDRDNSGRFSVPLKILLVCLGLSLAVAVTYKNTLNVPFLLDDSGNIVGNPVLDQFFPAPSESRLGLRRWVGHVSFAFNYAYGGLEERSFHVVNVLIHLACGLVLFDLVRRTLSMPSMNAPVRAAALGLATATAAFWMLHPLQTQGVTYIVQRLESLMSLFYLLSLYCVLRGARSARGLPWYMAAFLAFALGAGTKEVIVSAPIVVLLYDRAFLSDSWRVAFRHRWGLYLAFLLPVAWLVYLLSPAHETPFAPRVGTSFEGLTPITYLFSQAGVLVHYLRLSFYPVGLCFDYAWPLADGPSDYVAQGLVVLACLTASFIAFIWRPRIGFPGLAFFFILAPTSSILPINDLCVEHRMYLALAPICALFTLGVYRGWLLLLDRVYVNHSGGKRQKQNSSIRRERLRRVVPSVATVLVATTLGYLTFQRNEEYATKLSIWEDTANKRPNNARAWINLGNAYLDKGRGDAAVDAYTRAVQADPKNATAFNNRARIHADRSDFSTALDDFTNAIEHDSSHIKAYYGRGHIYLEMDRLDDAYHDFTKVISIQRETPGAVQVQPSLADALSARAGVLLKLQQFADAKVDLDEAIRELASQNREKNSRDGTIRASLRTNYHNRVFCHFKLGETAMAWQDVERIRKLGGQVDPRLLQLLSSARAN